MSRRRNAVAAGAVLLAGLAAMIFFLLFGAH